ncbi:hypothetical protein ACP4OV_029113 [Aristida adscensionis]
MAASDVVEVEVEVEADVLELGAAAAIDTLTARLFFSDDDAADAALSWPPAAEVPSALTSQRQLLALCDRYGVPSASYTPLCAARFGPGATASTAPPAGAISVYAAALEAGLRFPLHNFYVRLLRHYRLAPSQLAPNSWSYMAAFVILCQDAGVEPLVSVFRHFFTICAHKDKFVPLGWHHFHPFADRRVFKVSQLPRRFGWKKGYFFIKASPAATWPCPLTWGKPRRADVRRQELTGVAIEKLQQMAREMGGVDVKKLLLCSQQRLPVGELTLLQVKAEGVTSAAAAASTGKRKSPPAAPAVTPRAPPQQRVVLAATRAETVPPAGNRDAPAAASVTPPAPPPPIILGAAGVETVASPENREAQAAAAVTAPAAASAENVASATAVTLPSLPPPPPGFTPYQRRFGGHGGGGGERAQPRGLCGGEASLVWELQAEKAQMQEELQAAGAQVADLRFELRECKVWGSQLMELFRGSAQEANHFRAHLHEAGAMVAQLEQQASAKDKEHAAELARLQEEHAAGVARVKDAEATTVQEAIARAVRDMLVAVFPHADPLQLLQPEEGAQQPAEP